MIKKQKELVNDYVNKLTDLQYKNRKKDERYITLILLLAFVVEYLTAPTVKNVKAYAPFINDKVNVSDVDKTVKELYAGVIGKGELKGEIKTFKDNLPHYNYIINQRKSISDSGGGFFDFLKKNRLEEEAKLYEEANNISLFTNQMVFNKKRKIWNTQRDDRVRKTTFHNGVADMEVGINEPFTVGVNSAMYPSDSSLPNYERYNCRCYLTYK